MLFTCLCFAHALCATQSSPVEISVYHMRASKAMSIVQPLAASDSSKLVTLSADDARGVIVARGDSDGIRDVKAYIGLIDVVRRQVSLRVTVDSELDKESYEVSARILNSQSWKTSDADTGVSVEVTPRINDDGSVTMFINCGADSMKLTRLVMRLKPGSSSSLAIGSNASVTFAPGGSGHPIAKWPPSSSDPKITFHLDSVK